ncbi:MAG: nickel pincer cofactor biosynthesis protein LarC [Deltaproteobacteria bacterium]|nr:nickel pincer cofactor biosynthesis protein LarC [Deltaproteobacteria bacterium]MCZ6450160.1 nickel pincer cofactor biosynthesis protein LarC [Deltaproteobacteria bacterium]MCZ6621740.1 nickel pincer cofactor biosynthesis protein LarC [Deltaproteobacteria bacterium]MCZ6906654.1 nickel pincer cofactor biosynthesis protein LarC [Deltaproteobacteria bacterium]
MRIAYFDLISGLSGDMTVGALLHLGLPRGKLERELKKLPGLRYRLEVSKKFVNGIEATRFRVRVEESGAGRSWKTIRKIIKQSSLEADVKDRGLDIFARLAEAEGTIHGVPPDRVHFHEVGAIDSIVDIMATAIGTHHLKIDSFVFSSVPLGRGVTPSRHGPLPVPAPATLELLKGVSVQWINLDGETITPTGAAILSALGSQVEDAPRMTIEKIGYGAGEREFPDRPNLLRVLLGETGPAWGHDEMVVLETNIDDMNPEIYDYVLDRLFAAGARDVSLSPIQMKKNRPGTLLRIIGEPSTRDRLAEIIFKETSTIGIRYYPVKRLVLKRVPLRLKTRFGSVWVKMIEEPDGEKRIVPEYEELKKLAEVKKIPLKWLYDEVLGSFNKERGKGQRR